MYLRVSKFRFLKFWLLLSRVAPYLQFVTHELFDKISGRYMKESYFFFSLNKKPTCKEIQWEGCTQANEKWLRCKAVKL
jgi:hypothetical protein